MEKKIKTYKGFVIAENTTEKRLLIYTKDEWSYGKGLRYPEHDVDSIQEAKDFIDSY